MSLKERRKRYVLAHRDKIWDRATQGQRIVLNVIRNIAADRDIHVLDVGCGTGFVMKELKRSGIFVTGMEIAPNLFEHELKDLPVFYLSASNIGIFTPASFDIVLFCDSLPYMTEAEVDAACRGSSNLSMIDTMVTIETTKSPLREIDERKEWWDCKLTGHGFKEVENNTNTLFYRRPCANPAFN